LEQHFERSREGYRISTDPSLLDLNVIHGYLTRSYWSPGIPRDIVARAIAHSLNFGLYESTAPSRTPSSAGFQPSRSNAARDPHDGSGLRQVGFARVCTDHVTFAYLMDVFVLPEHRGVGLSVWLMESVMAHPALQNLRIFRLATRDAHALYEKVGFRRVQNPSVMMEINSPDVYLEMEQEP
jgi:ribosomal protein S18 acetylase RimI-like enzyme